jgi:hypothetical protein
LGDGGLKRLGRRTKVEGAVDVSQRGNEAAGRVDDGYCTVMNRLNQSGANLLGKHL